MGLLVLKGSPLLKFNYTASLIVLFGFSCLFTTLACAAAPVENLIRLNKTVVLTDDERAFIESLPTLKVAAYRQAAPLSLFDEKTKQYRGVSIDIFRFIAEQIGLSYQFVGDADFSLIDDLESIQDGRLDVYMPLTVQPDRLLYGVFTDSYFDDYYAIIARKNSNVQITELGQLSQYRVGTANKLSIWSYLQNIIPQQQLYEYASGTLLEGLRREEVDVGVYLQRTFEQDRLRLELFDLEKVYVLDEAPRSYTFMFARSEQNQRLVEIFNYFIQAIDSSKSLQWHADGERQLIQRYVERQKHQQLLWIALIAVSLLLLFLFMAFRSRQRVVAKLAKSHSSIMQQHQALQEANNKLKYLSQVDGLTGLANRRYFDQQFALEHARHVRSGASLSVLMLDIDFFKRINDHYGHAIGDVYLQQIATVLKLAMTRPSDLVARYGGEEFVCLLPDTHLLGAYKVAEKIRQAVIDLHLDNTEPQPQPVTISIGVATLQDPESSADDLLAQADEQLYRAKREGRNRVCSVLVPEDAPITTASLCSES